VTPLDKFIPTRIQSFSEVLEVLNQKFVFLAPLLHFLCTLANDRKDFLLFF